jgi:hypothetical protein
MIFRQSIGSGIHLDITDQKRTRATALSPFFNSGKKY